MYAKILDLCAGVTRAWSGHVDDPGDVRVLAQLRTSVGDNHHGKGVHNSGTRARLAWRGMEG
jgi:hypothetical protein